MPTALYSAAILIASIGLGFVLRMLVDGLPLTNRRLLIGGGLAAVGMLLLIAAHLA